MEFFKKEEKVKMKKKIVKLMEEECEIEERFLAVKAARQDAIKEMYKDSNSKKKIFLQVIKFCEERRFFPSEFFVYSCSFMNMDIVIAKGEYWGKRGYISPFVILFEEKKEKKECFFEFDIRNWPPLRVEGDINEISFKFNLIHSTTWGGLRICGITIFFEGMEEECFIPID